MLDSKDSIMIDKTFYGQEIHARGNLTQSFSSDISELERNPL